MKDYLKGIIAEKINYYKTKAAALEEDLWNLDDEELIYEVNIINRSCQHIAPWKHTCQANLENAIKKAIEIYCLEIHRSFIKSGEYQVFVVLPTYGKIEIPREKYEHLLDYAMIEKDLVELRKIYYKEVVV